MFVILSYEAAVAYGPGQPLVIEDVLVDPPKKMEVRIKIRFTSICHTDVSAWQGTVCIYYIYLNIFVIGSLQIIKFKKENFFSKSIF